MTEEHDRELEEKLHAEKTAAELSAQLKAIESELCAVKGQLEESEIESRRLSERVEVLERECEKLTEKREKAQEEFISLSEEHHSLKSKYSHSVDKNDKILKERTLQVTNLQQSLDDAHRLQSESNIIMKEQSSAIESKAMAVAHLEGEIKALKDRMYTAGDEKHELEALLRTSHSDLALTMVRLETLEKTMDEAKVNNSEKERQLKEQLSVAEGKYKQAEAACEAMKTSLQDLKDELSQKDNELHGNQSCVVEQEEIKKKLLVSEANLQRKENLLRDLENSSTAQAASLEKAQQDLRELQERFAVKDLEVRHLHADVEKSTLDLTKAKELAEEQKLKNESLNGLVVGLERKIDEQDLTIAEFKSQNADHCRERDALKVEVKLLHENLMITGEKLAACEKEVKEKLFDLGETQATLSIQSLKIQNLEEKLQKSNRELESVESLHDSLEKGEEMIKFRLEERESSIVALGEKLEEVNLLLSEERQSTQDLQEDLSNMEKDLNRTKVELEAEHERNTTLQVIADEKASELQGLTASLASLQEENKNMIVKLEKAENGTRICQTSSELLGKEVEKLKEELDCMTENRERKRHCNSAHGK